MNNEQIKPKAGDVVICTGGKEIGQMACLGGMVGSEKEEWHMCYNFNAFNDGNVVSCSGGMSYTIPTEELIATGRTRLATFWKWKDGIAGAGNGERYQEEVTLWEYQSEKAHIVYPAMSVKDILYRKSLNFDSSIFTPEDDSSGSRYEPMRGDYVFTNLEFPPKFGSRNYRDSAGETLFSAAQYFRSVYLSEEQSGNVYGYKFIVTVDASAFTAFKTEEELNAFIDAYKLTKVKREKDDGYLLVPNMEPSSWSQVHWKKLNDLAA